MKVKEHITELKKRLMTIVITAVVIFCICFAFSSKLLIGLINYYNIDAYAFSVLESINSQLRFSLIITILICIPLIFFELYAYCKPMLENRKAEKYVIASILLTLTGFILGFTWFSKLIIESLTSYSLFYTQASISSLISLAISIGFAMALCCNLIIIIPFLNQLGILDTKNMRKYIPHIIVVCVLFAGIITPGADIFSQVIVTVPLLGSIGLGTLFSKTKLHGGKKC